MSYATNLPITAVPLDTGALLNRYDSIAAYLFEYMNNGQIHGLCFKRLPVAVNGTSSIFCAQASLIVRLYWDGNHSNSYHKTRLVAGHEINDSLLYFSYQEVLDNVGEVIEKIKEHVGMRGELRRGRVE